VNKTVLIFTEQELKQYVQLNQEAVKVVEDAFTKLSKNEVMMPPIMRVDIDDQNGEVDVKTAYIKDKEMFAIKISSGFFNNFQLGLPSGNGMMILISTQTGVPEAILLDNGYLTDIRTAAAGAVAAKYLSKESIETVGIIGAGSQARYQLRSLSLVRNFNKVLVYARSPERALAFATEMAVELGVEITAVASAETVVRNSDTVITTTPAKEPIIKAEWLHSGLHITAMGSDAEHKQELEAEVLAKADLLVCDTKAQCARLGELQHALSQGLLSDKSPIIELGDLTSLKVAGRANDEQVTVCDLTGTGVQDTAIALFAYQEMVKRNLGLKIEGSDMLLKN
jgi:ectoine utilization protein EutC